LRAWECLDSATGEALAAAVHKYHLPDFSNWPPPAAFARAFARLEKALRTSLGKYLSRRDPPGKNALPSNAKSEQC
jgi:hypothetical protein